MPVYAPTEQNLCVIAVSKSLKQNEKRLSIYPDIISCYVICTTKINMFCFFLPMFCFLVQKWLYFAKCVHLPKVKTIFKLTISLSESIMDIKCSSKFLILSMRSYGVTI